MLGQTLNKNAHDALSAILSEKSSLFEQYRSLSQTHSEENEAVTTSHAQQSARYVTTSHAQQSARYFTTTHAQQSARYVTHCILQR